MDTDKSNFDPLDIVGPRGSHDGTPAATPEVEFDRADPHGKADARAIALERGREQGRAAFAGSVFDPASAVAITELQEIKERLDVIGSAVVAGVFLLGMITGMLAVVRKGVNVNG